MSETSARSGKKQARARKAKKIALIGGAVTVLALGVLAIIAFLPRGSDGFVIKIDNPEKSANFDLKAEKDGAPTTYLKGDSLRKTWPTTAKEEIDPYLSGFESLDAMAGSKNLKGQGTKADFDLALCYTVFLTNKSNSEATPFRYSVDLEGYKTPTTGTSLLEYLRFVVATSIVEEDNKIDHDLHTTYYGAPTLTSLGTEEGADDTREAISYQGEAPDATGEGKIRKSLYKCPTGSGYCVNFAKKEGKGLIDVEASIPAGKTLRFTFVAYLEGEDRDCAGDLPSNDSYLLFSLHFGI